MAGRPQSAPGWAPRGRSVGPARGPAEGRTTRCGNALRAVVAPEADAARLDGGRGRARDDHGSLLAAAGIRCWQGYSPRALRISRRTSRSSGGFSMTATDLPVSRKPFPKLQYIMKPRS